MAIYLLARIWQQIVNGIADTNVSSLLINHEKNNV